MNDLDVILKRFESPDESRTFEKGHFELVNVGLEEMDGFMAEKSKLYTEGAARMGLGKK